jgi:hypothetical protein
VVDVGVAQGRPVRRRQRGTADTVIALAPGADIRISFYGADPIRSLALKPVGELRAELGAVITFEVVGIERVTIEGQA